MAPSCTSRPLTSRRRRSLLLLPFLPLLAGCGQVVTGDGLNDYDPSMREQDRDTRWSDYKSEQQGIEDNYREADGN